MKPQLADDMNTILSELMEIMEHDPDKAVVGACCDAWRVVIDAFGASWSALIDW